MKPQGLRLMLVGCSEEWTVFLQSQGHEVLRLPEQKVSRNRSLEPYADVVVLDLQGSTPNPLRVAQELFVFHPRKPLCVALVESESDELESEFRRAGVDLLLLKPVRLVSFSQLLQRLSVVVQDYAAFDPVI